MLKPKFSLEQTNEHVVLCATCPLVHVQDIEYCLDEREFYFYAKPYYLRLCFNESFSTVQDVKCQYDIDTGNLSFLLPKHTIGQEFTDLEFMTKLVFTSYTKPIVESNKSLVEELDNDPQIDDDDLSFFSAETISHQENHLNISSKYGFNDGYSKVFIDFPQDYCNEILDISSPESSTLNDRITWQEEHEANDFDPEHYMADYADQDNTIKNLIDLECLSLGTIDEPWNEKEKEQLLSLKNKSYILDDPKSIYFGLVDILLAYSYNRRITEMENTVESCWTISKLSSTLSWLITRNSLNETIRHFYIRGLCYPLYRHWDLLVAAQRDTVNILKTGKKIILKALLEIKDLFDHDECKYILSLLYLDDYCVWIQSASVNRINFLANAIEEIIINKDDNFPWSDTVSIKDLELNVLTSK